MRPHNGNGLLPLREIDNLVTFLCLLSLQVWFQNRRSKERRMKQLNALGARRHFFRNPRRMRGLRPGEELGDNPELLGQPSFNYFGEFDVFALHACV